MSKYTPLTFGKYKGLSYQYVYQHDPEYYVWASINVNGFGCDELAPPYAAAADQFINQPSPDYPDCYFDEQRQRDCIE